MCSSDSVTIPSTKPPLSSPHLRSSCSAVPTTRRRMANAHVELNFAGAAISGDPDEKNPPISLPNQSSGAPLIAVDIGGTLIKLVYFCADDDGNGVGGRLQFANFDKTCLNECLDFIDSRGLLRTNGLSNAHATIKATGGGAVKYADVFEEKLGVTLDRMDEMQTIVAGANFLLQNIPNEPFTFKNGTRTPVCISNTNAFPYLLVNIGSAVSMLKVMGDRKFGSEVGMMLGGGTVFGLAKLLTGCTSYDNFLELGQLGDTCALDLIAKGLQEELVCKMRSHPASSLDSGFEDVTISKGKISDYKAEDIAASLLSTFTHNIAQVSFLAAEILRLKRIVFGGSYIHGDKTIMNTISYAIDCWSRGETEAVFLRHEGFLGALGAFVGFGSNDLCDAHPEDVQGQECSNEVMAPSYGRPIEETDEPLFPNLVANIGSGVSMIEVIKEGKIGRITRTHLGGGTILGLAKLLTGCTSYNEFLEMSQRGNNVSIDLTSGDIYGELGYPELGVIASEVISSFGKITSNKLSDYKVEDLAASLLQAFMVNNGQIAYLIAILSGLKRIFLRGNCIGCQSTVTDNISVSLSWCRGQVCSSANCLEWFMQAQGAWLSHEDMVLSDFAVQDFTKLVQFGGPNVDGKSPT